MPTFSQLPLSECLLRSSEGDRGSTSKMRALPCQPLVGARFAILIGSVRKGIQKLLGLGEKEVGKVIVKQ